MAQWIRSLAYLVLRRLLRLLGLGVYRLGTHDVYRKGLSFYDPDVMGVYDKMSQQVMDRDSRLEHSPPVDFDLIHHNTAGHERRLGLNFPPFFGQKSGARKVHRSRALSGLC